MHWFERVFLDDDRGVGDSMDVPFDATSDEAVAGTGRRTPAATRSCGHAPTCRGWRGIANPGEDEIDSLRRIVAHMIEETARHAGHADILREQIDGATDL